MKGSDQRFSHSKWDCKYDLVFGPKYRRLALYEEIRQQLGAIFHELAKKKECQALEGHQMPDPVHMRLAIPPKQAVASVIGFMKGQSAIAIVRLQGKARNFAGEHFCARGYAVSTVCFNEDEVRRYIHDQQGADGSGCF